MVACMFLKREQQATSARQTSKIFNILTNRMPIRTSGLLSEWHHQVHIAAIGEEFFGILCSPADAKG